MKSMRIVAFAVGTAVVSVLGFAPGSFAGDTAPMAVSLNDDMEVSTSLTGKAGDAEAGRKWFAGRKLGNCLACHANTNLNEQPFHGDVGPSMDGIADRYNEGQLRAIVVDAKTVFGKQTIMPGFYSEKLGVRVSKKFKGKTILSAQQVEDVVAYLKTLKE